MNLRLPRPHSALSGHEARRIWVSKALSRLLPAIEDAHYKLSIHPFRQWKVWCSASLTSLVTATPYYVLLTTLGKWAIINPASLVFMAAKRGNPLITVAVMILLATLAFPRLRRRIQNRKNTARTRFRDRPYMSVIAFLAESETWTERERLKACVAYSLTLQCRGIFPVFTVLTAIASNRLFMAIYHSELARGSREHALSHVITVRIARIFVAGAMGLTAALAAFVTRH